MLAVIRVWMQPRLVPFALTLLLSACTTAPVEQIKYFSQAFNTVNTVGQPLLDELAIAERLQGRQIAVRRAKGETQQGVKDCPPEALPWFPAADSNQGIIRGFCLPDAAYFSMLTDPPATAAMRGALSVIERYAEILSTLAENRNTDSALAEIDALSKSVSGLVAVTGLASTISPIGPALIALRPVLEHAAQQGNAREAKRLILDGAPKVTDLIAALRNAIPPMFKTLIESTSAKLTSEADANPAVASADVAHVEAYRSTVANYAVLLSKLQNSWDITVDAARAPAGKTGLASLVQQTTELKRDAEAARRAFSILRAGATPLVVK